MTENEIKALVVGPEDALFVVFKGEDVTRDNIRAMGKSIYKTRPELKEEFLLWLEKILNLLL